jgi:hypothetical protein
MYPRLPALWRWVLRQCAAPPITGNRFDRTRDEARHWFMALDLDVMVNLNDVCSALGLDVKTIQRSVLPVIRRAPGRLILRRS